MSEKRAAKLLHEHAIRGPQWRAKNAERLNAKLLKYAANKEHEADFADVESVFRVLKDLAGARVTTYQEADRAKVVSLLQKRFASAKGTGAVEADVKDKDGKFYRATHCFVSLKTEDLIGRYENLKSLGCEVQVCSLLAHVYNEIEHDLRYKPLSGKLSGKEDELLNALGHLMSSGDTIINQTLDAVEVRQKAERV